MSKRKMFYFWCLPLVREPNYVFRNVLAAWRFCFPFELFTAVWRVSVKFKFNKIKNLFPYKAWPAVGRSAPIISLISCHGFTKDWENFGNRTKTLRTIRAPHVPLMHNISEKTQDDVLKSIYNLKNFHFYFCRTQEGPVYTWLLNFHTFGPTDRAIDRPSESRSSP